MEHNENFELLKPYTLLEYIEDLKKAEPDRCVI